MPSSESSTLLEKENINEAAKSRPLPSWPVTVLISAIMGLAFGLAFYKSHVYEPQMIRGQFLFQRFVMLKVFFGAMGTGAILLAILNVCGVAQFKSARELWRPTATSRNWLTGSALGGCLLGVGMATSGACPGMVLVALGSGTPNSIWTILGGLLGAFIYGWNAETIQKHVLDKGGSKGGPASKVYADEAMGIQYSKMAAVLGVFCILGCVALETLVPWKSEVPVRFNDIINGPSCAFGTSTFNFWDCPAWPPSLAGALVGALQLPTVLFIETLLGSATAFQVCASCWMLPLSEEFRSKHSYLNAFATPNPKAWWQVIYVALAVLISYSCAKNDHDVGGAAGVSMVAALAGGFLLIFASRLGGGCTSGHGLSGCSILLVQSWVAVPAMFAGGIGIAVLWQLQGNGEFYNL